MRETILKTLCPPLPQRQIFPKCVASDCWHVGAEGWTPSTILDTDSGILVRERDVMLPCCYGDWWWLGWCRQLFLPPNVIEPLLIILCRKDISARARRGAETRHHNPQWASPLTVAWTEPFVQIYTKFAKIFNHILKIYALN